MPAVAVRRRAQALSGFIGRKESRRRSNKLCFKDQGSTLEQGAILLDLKIGGDFGTSSGAVKCVDIGRNT
ncbi:MAG: hypothetical protein LiPW16_152, partial [Microgenomates group bacterium LiPW_16]